MRFSLLIIAQQQRFGGCAADVIKALSLHYSFTIVKWEATDNISGGAEELLFGLIKSAIPRSLRRLSCSSGDAHTLHLRRDSTILVWVLMTHFSLARSL